MLDSLKNIKLTIRSFALSVHGIAGVWGTLSTGFFATSELATVGAAGLFYGGGFAQFGVQVSELLHQVLCIYGILYDSIRYEEN